jgi:hypothetical protein
MPAGAGEPARIDWMVEKLQERFKTTLGEGFYRTTLGEGFYRSCV